MPDQIYPGDNFVNGQQVNADRLNNHVGNAILQKGAITEQTVNNNVATGDEIIFVDVSASTLNKTTVGNVLVRNLPVIASSVRTSMIDGPLASVDPDPNVDNNVTLVPRTFNKVGGVWALTEVDSQKRITVTLANHGLYIGDTISIIFNTGTFNGRYLVRIADASTFVIFGSWTSGGSGTVTSFTKEGSGKVAGNAYVSGDFYAQGAGEIIGQLKVNSILIGGKTPLTVQDNLSKIYIKSGVSAGDWTSTAGTEKTVYQTPILPTPPTDETWTYTFNANFTGGDGRDSNTRTAPGMLHVKLYKNATVISTQVFSGGVHHFTGTSVNFSISITSADVGVVVALKALSYWTLMQAPCWTVTLTKVKTAALSDATSCI